MQIRESEIEFGNVESLLESIKREPVDSDTAVIVLKINNPALQTSKNTYDLRLCGKTLLSWVEIAFGSCPITEVVCDMSTDILSAIRPHLSNKKYTAVFYADTPLLERKTFLNILDYVQTKRLNVCKLLRGYVFVTDFVRNCEKIYTTTENHDFGKDNFLTICNMSNLEYAGQILKNRILNFHEQNGVQFVDKNSTFVDADVTIGKNVVIFPNNMIFGESVIEEGATIGPFCTIKNSKIGKNVSISNSYVENSEVKENSKIMPYTTIISGGVKVK